MAALTLVIVNHNNSQWLGDCFSSVNKQTLAEFELLFVDDASTDDSIARFEQYPWRQGITHTLVRLPENVGVSKARIAGMSRVATEYVTNLDSDDFLISEHKLLREFELARQHSCNIAFSRIILVNGKGAPLPTQPRRPIQEGNLHLAMLRRSIMIPRDFIMPFALYQKAGGYDPEINLYEDWDLKIRLAALGSFHYTGLDGIGYRRHDQGLSAVAVNRHREALARVITKNLPLYSSMLTLEQLLEVLHDLNLTTRP